MNDYVLRTRSISKKYGDTYALQNVNVEIKKGQTVIVISSLRMPVFSFFPAF